MISQTNSSALRSAYPSKTNDTQEPKRAQAVSPQNEMSKTEALKKSIDSGEYKVDINALSQKMADALL